MQAIGRQPQRPPDGDPIDYVPHRPEQTTVYCLVQQHAASFIAHTEASTESQLPRFVKDAFDAFLACDILAHDFLRLRRGDSRAAAQRIMPPAAWPAAPGTLSSSRRRR